MEPPKLGYYSGFGEVKKITQNDGKTEPEITDNYTSEVPYDCVETTKIDRIQNGRIIYREICKFGKNIKETKVKLTLGELPEGVSIQVGDKVEGYTIVEKHEEKTVTDTKPLVKKTELWVLELSHLAKLTRKGKAVGKWF